jgi:hypothetical protein
MKLAQLWAAAVLSGDEKFRKIRRNSIPATSIRPLRSFHSLLLFRHM